ncbi:MAG: hypothetical protein AYK22_06105 [Thermoplasmatales archaeon SG8-52-3]|nr:MAG: hypothetical protein AYK22_06105 [Thermoplasmatales archaeon SG8-52-3]
MKSSIVKKGIVFVIIILFFGAGILPSTLGNIKQKTEFTICYSRGYIQELINNAEVGDTINIPSGTYYENIIINKTINLVGAGKETTILMPTSIYRDLVDITADWVNLSGFTIRKAAEDRYGIEISSNYNTIKNNNISENYNSGIKILEPYNKIIDNEIFSNNNLGIEIIDTNLNTIEGNIISSNEIGIELIESTNNIITDNEISKNEYGINMDYDSIANTITDNIVNSNGFGIDIFSKNNNINGNTISNNDCGINLEGYNNNIESNSFLNDGLYVCTSIYNNIVDNTVNGKSLVYLENESNMIIDSNAGQIILINCNEITIKNLNIIDTHIGIILIKSNNCLITSNQINSNIKNGIDLYRSSYNEIKDNYLSNNEIGIFILNSDDDNTIAGNTITTNEFYGIVLSSSNNNVIRNNEIESHNGYGINLITSKDNSITSNNISDNNLGIAILSTGSYGNEIYHNNFLNNDQNAHDNSDIGNTWDDGTYGNYWSDYREKYPDAKKKTKEGIWDTPYEITGRDNIDYRPLIKQWPKTSTTNPQSVTTIFSSIKLLLERFPMLERLIYLLVIS